MLIKLLVTVSVQGICLAKKKASAVDVLTPKAVTLLSLFNWKESEFSSLSPWQMFSQIQVT